MKVVFQHQAFPAQFGKVALELTKRYGWDCTCMIESYSKCPTPDPEMLEKLEILQVLPPVFETPDRRTPWPQTYGRYLLHCQSFFHAACNRISGTPDLVISHGGRGPLSLFLPERFQCPIINYSEFYFAQSHRDISYRIDLPQVEPAPFFPRCINAPTLLGMVDCVAGYSATRFQRKSFPKRFLPKIEVHFDGVDTELYKPRKVERRIMGTVIPPDTKIITYAARGLESMRGFDMFARAAEQISATIPNVLFVVCGSDETYYGWDSLHTKGVPFREWTFQKYPNIDPNRFLFLGQVLPTELADIMCMSDLHIYLTVPFVLSWSLVDALASGCLVLAADVEPVREFVVPGKSGELVPFFDVDELSRRAISMLRHSPRDYRKRARDSIVEHFSIEVAIPRLKDFFERIANGQQPQGEKYDGPAPDIC